MDLHQLPIFWLGASCTSSQSGKGGAPTQQKTAVGLSWTTRIRPLWPLESSSRPQIPSGRRKGPWLQQPNQEQVAANPAPVLHVRVPSSCRIDPQKGDRESPLRAHVPSHGTPRRAR